MKRTKKALSLRDQRLLIVVNELKRLFPDAPTVLQFSNPWELLVAVMLSAQCTDARVNQVTPALFAAYPDVHASAHATLRSVEQLVRSTGYFRQKAKRIVGSALRIEESFGGLIPRTMAKLLELPGVARKTASVVLWNAYGIIEGIPVDTHVRRLVRIYGLSSFVRPDRIERDLMQRLSREEWPHFTNRLIAYGRTYCPARRHEHTRCPLTVALMR